MKKLIVLFLAIITLLSGCTLTQKEHTLSQYGIAITTLGNIREEEGNKSGNFTLYTSVGTISFLRFPDADPPINEKNVKDFKDQYDTENLSEIKALENGAFYFALPPRDSGSGQGTNVVEAYYFIQNGADIWRISTVNLEENHNDENILSVLTSIRFLDAEN